MMKDKVKEPATCNHEDISDDHVITIRCLSSVPDELINLLSEVEKKDLEDAGL